MFVQTKDSQVLGRQSRGLAVGYPDELRLRPANAELLRSIANASGGRFEVKPESVFDSPDRTSPRAVPLWPYLATAAALLFVLDVALRRIDLSVVFPRVHDRECRPFLSPSADSAVAPSLFLACSSSTFLEARFRSGGRHAVARSLRRRPPTRISQFP